MFTVKMIASKEAEITSDELSHQCDMALSLVYDVMRNIISNCVDNKYIKNKIYTYQGSNKPLIIDTFLSDTSDGRNKFLLNMAPVFKTIESKLLQKGISFEVQTEDHVTEFMGSEEWL